MQRSWCFVVVILCWAIIGILSLAVLSLLHDDQRSIGRIYVDCLLIDFCISSKNSWSACDNTGMLLAPPFDDNISKRDHLILIDALFSFINNIDRKLWGYTATYCYLFPLLSQPITTIVDFTYVRVKCYDCIHWCFCKWCFYQFGTLLVLAVQETKKKKLIVYSLHVVLL